MLIKNVLLNFEVLAAAFITFLLLSGFTHIISIESTLLSNVSNGSRNARGENKESSSSIHSPFIGVNMHGFFTIMAQSRDITSPFPPNYYEDSFRLLSNTGL